MPGTTTATTTMTSPTGRAPRARRPAAIRYTRSSGSGRLESIVEPNPAWLVPWTAERGIDAERSSLEAIGGALQSAQAAALAAPDFGSAYDALLDLSQIEHARRAGFRQSDVLSKQQHVIVSSPSFDARLSWFWHSTSWRLRTESLARCLLEDSAATDSEIARRTAERLGSPRLAGSLRKVTGSARRLVVGRRVLRVLTTHLPEVTVDDVKREFGVEGRGDGVVVPLLMMSWRGEL